MEGKMNSGDAHLAVDYQKVLEIGLKGYEQRVRKLKQELDSTELDSIEKYHFYESVLIVLEAVTTFANRFATLAKEIAQTAIPERATELLEISRICCRISGSKR